VAPPELLHTAPVELRSAHAADVPLIAQVLEMSGRGHLERGAWDVLFPDAAERERALRRIAGGRRSWCQQSVFHVAAVDGRASAAMAAFEPAALGGTSLAGALADAFADLRWTTERSAEALERAAPYMLCFPDMPDGSWIVENVGTLASHRRRGLVAALLERVLEEGRRLGHDRAQISCLIGNEPARFAYERAGFAVVEERRHPAFEALLGSPGFFRMTRPLAIRAIERR
jgi:GNAT superfamily N-acetyltransferase